MVSPSQISSHDPAAPRIELRPWDYQDWPLVWEWFRESWSMVADDFAPTNLNAFVHWKRDNQATFWTRFGVWRDGELGGILEAFEVNPVVAQIHVCFKKSFWGSHTTLEALRQGAEWCWEREFEKLWALVYPDNHAIIRIIKLLGGQFEGILVNHTKRNGILTDLNSYAILAPKESTRR